MAIKSSGSLSMTEIVAEFGGSVPHSLSEYYREGGAVPGNNTNVPTSGTISMGSFYNAVNEIQQVYSSNATNLNLSSIFGSNWGSTVPKRVVINSGVTIGGTGGNYAIEVPTGMAGTLVIDNAGSIEGHGGAANGGAGGNAVHCAQTSGVTINNTGAIKAGGGGGGQGGTGGTGGNGGTGGTGGQGRYSNLLCNVYHYASWNHPGACTAWNCSQGATHATHYHTQYGYDGTRYWVACYNWAYSNGGSGGAGGTSGGAGGNGGTGGRGQGYNEVNHGGAAGAGGSSGGSGSGGASGGTNAGAGGTGGSRGTGGQGGTGGTGGTFGNSGVGGATGSSGNQGATGNSGANGNYTNGSSGSAGSNGSSGSGGSAGGVAGYYIYNRASITLNNSGTVAGR